MQKSNELRPSVASSTLEEVNRLRGKIEVRNVDVLIAGGGPATLGLLCNAMKTSRLKELVTPTGDSVSGIAILEKGVSLGGGNLQHYLINSNTSADGFANCLYGYKEKN